MDIKINYGTIFDLFHCEKKVSGRLRTEYSVVCGVTYL